MDLHVLSTAHRNAERHGCPVRLSELQGFGGMLIAELLNCTALHFFGFFTSAESLSEV